MMEIQKTQNGCSLLLALQGRLDTTTAPQLEEALMASLSGVTELTLDFADLNYISSAGLRVILSTQKLMNKQGTMRLCHVAPSVMEVFEITGFSDILTIE